MPPLAVEVFLKLIDEPPVRRLIGNFTLRDLIAEMNGSQSFLRRSQRQRSHRRIHDRVAHGR